MGEIREPEQAPRRGRFRFAPTLRLQDSLALAAFLMSLAVTLINVYYAMRGSDLSVDPPAQLILYRDGEGDAAVLTVAARLEMINGSDGYGDVLKDATLSFDDQGSSFEYQGTVRTVLAGNDADAKPSCELGLRCLQLPGLHIVERSDEILETPGGTARVFTLSFPLVAWNCAGDSKRCERFGNFAAAARALPREQLTSTLRLRFHSDGARRLTCVTKRLELDYLLKVGWISIPCA